MIMGGEGVLPRSETRAFGFAVTMADAAGIARLVATRRRAAGEGVGRGVTPHRAPRVQLRRAPARARADRPAAPGQPAPPPQAVRAAASW